MYHVLVSRALCIFMESSLEGLHPTQIAQVGADRGSHCQTIWLVVLPHRPLTCKAHLELHCAVTHVLAMIAEENELNFGMHFH